MGFESPETVCIPRFSSASTILDLSVASISPLSDISNCTESSPATPSVLSDLESVTLKLIGVLFASA